MRIIEEVQPSWIFANGRIYTVDDDDRVAGALAVAGTRVMAVGSDEEVLSLAGPHTQVRDLRGRTVIPGIIDSHNHAWEAGQLMEGLITFGIPGIDELKESIAERVMALAPGCWLQGGGWIETQFRENRMPNRWDLDEAAPDHPVVLERIFSTCTVNSRALEAAGITHDTPDPAGGKIERDPETGEPTGILHGAAKLLVRRHMPGAFGADAGGSEEGMEESVSRALAEYVRWGITGIVEPGVSPGICRAYQGLRSRGELPVRVCLMPNWHGFPLEHDEERMDRMLDDMGFHTGFGDEWLRLGGLKMAIDGGLTSKTALLSWPYRGEEEPREVELRLDPDRLKGWVWAAHRAGWSVGIHVVGDVSQEMAVEAIWEAQRYDPRPHRHQVIHGYYPTERALKMMAGAQIIAAVQPSFIYGEADGYPELLDPDRQESFLPLRSYHEAGVTVALSSDMPSAHFNPFWGLYAAVTRRGMNGHQLGERETVTAAEGLRMMTLNNAYLTGEEDRKGSLEPGKLADLVILDRDILGVSAEEIRDTVVCASMVGGWMAFDGEPDVLTLGDEG